MNKTHHISSQQLFHMLKEAYRHGYATREHVEAGLEPYDADGYANWVVLSLD
jgi:hypothetical protein